MQCICGDNNQQYQLILDELRQLQCRIADVVERLHILEEFADAQAFEDEGEEDYTDDDEEEECDVVDAGEVDSDEL